jgi:hypothetical protein
MKYIIIFLIFILSIINVSANNNIYQFDEKSEIILTTSVYKNGIPNSNATCNLTIFNPPPNENIINLSVYMNNKGNGIYSYNLTNQIAYNKEIYPLTLSCNDSTGFVGYDDRVGIKIGVKLYDFIIPGIVLMTIAFLFIYISFSFGKDKQELKIFMFYAGLLFVLISLFYGLSVVNQIPSNTGMKTIFITTISIFIMLILLLVYLQFTDKLGESVNLLLGSK